MSQPTADPPPGCDAPTQDADEWLAGLSVEELDEIAGSWPDDQGYAELDAAEFGAAEFDVGEYGAAGGGAEAGAGWLAGGDVLDVLPPDPLLAVLAQDAFDQGLGKLPDDELVGVLCAARRLSSRQAAIELAAVSELDARRQRAARRPGWSRTSEHVSAELALELTLTGRSADTLLSLARGLARLPGVRAALFAGRIDRDRAAVFAAELTGLGDIAAAAVAAAFAGLAGSMTTGQLRAALRAMVLAVDPGAARRRAEKGRAEARIEFWQESSGNAGLAGRELPAADAIAADKRIAAIARALKDAGAPGTADQLRAAVFTALLAGRDPDSLLPAAPGTPGTAGSPDPSSPGSPDPSNPSPGKPAPAGLAGLSGSVNLTMPFSAWLGTSEAPGEIAGLGPADARTCHDLAGRLATGPSTRWCVTLTDRDGRAAAHACARAGPSGPSDHTNWLATLDFDWLERGTCAHSSQADSYRPPGKLRELIKIRQRTCAFPGCRWPARACDDDHTKPYDQGGRTCQCNLAPLCRNHHRAKQAPGWGLTQPSPGVLVWTTPAGRSYTMVPDTYPI